MERGAFGGLVPQNSKSLTSIRIFVPTLFTHSLALLLMVRFVTWILSWIFLTTGEKVKINPFLKEAKEKHVKYEQ